MKMLDRRGDEGGGGGGGGYSQSRASGKVAPAPDTVEDDEEVPF